MSAVTATSNTSPVTDPLQADVKASAPSAAQEAPQAVEGEKNVAEDNSETTALKTAALKTANTEKTTTATEKAALPAAKETIVTTETTSETKETTTVAAAAASAAAEAEKGAAPKDVDMKSTDKPSATETTTTEPALPASKESATPSTEANPAKRPSPEKAEGESAEKKKKVEA